MYPESKSSDSSRERFLKFSIIKCQGRGKFCEISEEYDVKTTLL